MGHRGSDVFPYGILDEIMTPQFNFYGKVGPNMLNNRELVHLFDPNVNGLSYIYDNFDWEHCTESGYVFFFSMMVLMDGYVYAGSSVDQVTILAPTFATGGGDVVTVQGPLLRPRSIVRAYKVGLLARTVLTFGLSDV